MARDGIETAFCSQFPTFLRNDTCRMGFVTQGNIKHFRCRRHFQIERQVYELQKPCDVFVSDVAPVLAQVGRDAVGACLRRQRRRSNGIGMFSTPRVSNRRDMIDVDAKSRYRQAVDRHTQHSFHFRRHAVSCDLAVSATLAGLLINCGST